MTDHAAYSRAHLAALFPEPFPPLLATAPVNFAGDLVDEARRALCNAAYLHLLSEQETETAPPDRLRLLQAARHGEARLGHACLQLAIEKHRRA